MMRQNETMTQIMRELQLQIEKTLAYLEAADGNTNTTDEAIPNLTRTTLTSAKRVIELYPSQAEKSPQIIAVTGTPREIYRTVKEIAQYMFELNNSYILLERSRALLQLQAEQDREKIPELEARAEFMGERIKNIEDMQTKVAELEAERQKLHFWEVRRRKVLDREIERLEGDIRVAQHAFNSKFHVSLGEASFELCRIQKEVQFKRSELDRKIVRAAEIRKDLDAIEVEYRSQKQIADGHPDKALIYSLLAQMRETPASTRKSLRQIQIERHLDAIADGKIR